MRFVVAVIAAALVAACTTATPGFDTLTPPPASAPVGLPAVAPTFALPSRSLVPPSPAPRTVAPSTATPARASASPPAAIPAIFVVWSGAPRAADGSIPFLVVMKDFPPNTPITLVRYRDPSGMVRALNRVVTTRAVPAQTTTEIALGGVIGDHALDYEHPLSGRTQGQVTFTLSKTIVDRAAGVTAASPCPAATLTARFEPAQIARSGTASLRLTGVCPGEIVTFTRTLTASGRQYGQFGEPAIVLYRDGIPWRPSDILGLGTHRVFLWVKGTETSALIEVR